MNYRFKYDDIAEFVAACSKPRVCEVNTSHDNETRLNGWLCSDRHHIGSVEAARRALAAVSFPAGVKRVAKLGDGLQAPTPISVRRVPRQSDSGDELDIHRVWQGELDTAWRRMNRENRIGPSRVLIAVNVLATAGTDAEKLAMRGAAALALANALRLAGHTVSIVAVCDAKLYNREHSRYRVEIAVLQPGQDIDENAHASLLASGLLFRGLIISHMHRVSHSPVEAGTCPGNSKLQADSFDAGNYNYTAVLENGECSTQYSAEQWINGHIKAIDPNAE